MKSSLDFKKNLYIIYTTVKSRKIIDKNIIFWMNNYCTKIDTKLMESVFLENNHEGKK